VLEKEQIALLVAVHMPQDALGKSHISCGKALTPGTGVSILAVMMAK
jgi:hypothetical protein